MGVPCWSSATALRLELQRLPGAVPQGLMFGNGNVRARQDAEEIKFPNRNSTHKPGYAQVRRKLDIERCATQNVNTYHVYRSWMEVARRKKAPLTYT